MAPSQFWINKVEAIQQKELKKLQDKKDADDKQKQEDKRKLEEAKQYQKEIEKKEKELQKYRSQVASKRTRPPPNEVEEGENVSDEEAPNKKCKVSRKTSSKDKESDTDMIRNGAALSEVLSKIPSKMRPLVYPWIARRGKRAFAHAARQVTKTGEYYPLLKANEKKSIFNKRNHWSQMGTNIDHNPFNTDVNDAETMLKIMRNIKADDDDVPSNGEDTSEWADYF